MTEKVEEAVVEVGIVYQKISENFLPERDKKIDPMEGTNPREEVPIVKEVRRIDIIQKKTLNYQREIKVEVDQDLKISVKSLILDHN
uniref:Uncharacterized protein n=1 Tax=uncultured Poseidoniia archaeon TaxID=1697135 RepID=A0A1B1TAY8_9ARCH|nr:hypothetical protein [uncultured Candidatus Thalassoarchaea sp.]